MAGLPSSLMLPAGSAIRLPAPAETDTSRSTAGRPIQAVFPPPPLRDDPQTRQPRQDQAEGRGQRPHATDQAPMRQSRFRGAFAPRPDSTATIVANGTFLAHVLSQKLGPTAHAIALHRDGPALGSDIYRRAGGEPALYSEEPRLLRISV